MNKEEKLEKEKIRQEKVAVLERMIGRVIYCTEKGGFFGTIVSVVNEEEVKVKHVLENITVSIFSIRSI